ncbi:Uncharacterised protein (plasmid) [Legionella adelaidensis]|uniref:Uncharacterized protein n=1 Tax=Legionella adelaidensis TaxID=45056 RepID=A0A0W0R3A7_9GAMM|nr:TMEM14 family protein [Legionella adelaidensis]KTC65516.1 hypothetical protein Lade_0174 [Legionella adelaidensis]VEH84663.1 Uncharacterised protein [Legionella adelaidensis]
MTLIPFTPEIRLDQITAENYWDISAKPKIERENIAKLLVESLTEQDFLLVVSHLSDVCFTVCGPLFIRQGASNFLADLIKRYVDTYDGEKIAELFNLEGPQGLGKYTFSQRTVALVNTLVTKAREKQAATGKPEYFDYLAANITNKVWQPIIANRLAPTHELAKQLQQFALNKEIGHKILHQCIIAYEEEAYADSVHSSPSYTYAFTWTQDQEQRYGIALDTLRKTINEVISKPHLKKDAEKIIIQIESHKLAKDINPDTLIACLVNNKQFLTARIRKEQYLEQAEKLKGVGFKILGGLMIAFAIALITSGFFLTSIPIGVNIAFLTGGFFIGTMGMRFFKKPDIKASDAENDRSELNVGIAL